jgi:hypothetical protein
VIEPSSPAKLLELATAYQRSKILFEMIRLDLATLLARGPRSLEDIGSSVGVDPLAAERFLDACVALGLLVREEDSFRNAPDSQRFLVRGTPAFLGDALTRYDRVSQSTAWGEFDQRLRSWRAGSTESPISLEGAPRDGEFDGQHRLSLLAGEALGRALDLSAKHRLADLGGGTGAMSIALCERFTNLKAIVVESAEMVPVASAYVRERRLLERIGVREGDFVSGPLPAECDVVLLANVLSLFSVDGNRRLFGRIFEHLPAGGTLVLSGWMLDDHQTGATLPLLLSLEDIILRAPDVEHSTAEYADWLARAGFERIDRARYFEPMSYVVGHKPRRT